MTKHDTIFYGDDVKMGIFSIALSVKMVGAIVSGSTVNAEHPDPSTVKAALAVRKVRNELDLVSSIELKDATAVCTRPFSR